jgi:hypothetical protein
MRRSCSSGAWLCLLGAALVFAAGCAAPSKRDYSLYRARSPRSVLVLPPINQSVEVNAPYGYLSTISRPLAECGYYVFPVAVIDAFLKENGLPTPAEMHAVSLERIREVLGADAVLYVTIEEYGQKYMVLSSVTVVRAHAALVEVATGATLWEGRAQAVQSSGDSGGGIIGALVTAVVTQIIASASDNAHTLAVQANTQMIFDPNSGLLFGPYNPERDRDTRGR